VLYVAQPGHWLGPVIGLGWLGLAQSMWADRAQPKKIKKIKNNNKNKKCVWMNKNNANLLIYSLTPESGIKIPV
jgi:hypothetical protein